MEKAEKETKMSYNVLLEELISNIGGCGKFQWILTALVHLSKTISTWSMIHMSFNGLAPDFCCADGPRTQNLTDKASATQPCSGNNCTGCSNFQFDDSVSTVVSEWDLVCDRAWIVATITTIQMAGVLVGCFISGHLGDLIGRKPTYFLSILMLVILNIIAYFSVSWEMYATVRFMLGLGVGFFITLYRNQMIEYATSIWRPRIMGVPSWPIEAGFLALLTWLCKDWKIIHIASAIAGAPFLLTWWFIPESFRWLITTGKYAESEEIIGRVAKMNGHEKPDIRNIIEQAKQDEKQETKRYTAIDLFRTKRSAIKTLALMFTWASVSYAYYGLTFGLKNFAGDFYLNMFLTYAVEIPAELAAMYMANKIGRKKSCILGMFFTAICGIINGILQYVDVPSKPIIINVFAIASKIGNTFCWLPMAVLSTETYPTVIRSTAFGVVNTSARVGGMIAPQIVFLNDSIPGMLFFLSGAVMVVSGLLCFIFKETRGLALEDTLQGNYKKKTKGQRLENKLQNNLNKETRASGTILVTD